MKKDIHPKYDLKTKATCVCGAVFEVGSTLPEIRMEICSNCEQLLIGGVYNASCNHSSSTKVSSTNSFKK